MRWPFPLLLLAGAAASLRAGEAGLTLVVTIANVVPGGGPVRVAVWRDAAGWPLTPAPGAATVSVDAIADAVTVRIPDQRPGRLAVTVYQDLDRDGRLRQGTFGPKEPWGTSRNVRHAFRGPTFAESAVTVTAAEAAIAITLER